MFQPELIDLQARLATSPFAVERDIAVLLGRLPVSGDDDDAFRLRRYQRKIDVAHKLMAAYDELIEKVTSTSTVSSDGYLGLTLVFVQAARRESGASEASCGNILRFANSAFNCLDHVTVKDADVALSELGAEIQALLRKGSAL